MKVTAKVFVLRKILRIYSALGLKIPFNQSSEIVVSHAAKFVFVAIPLAARTSMLRYFQSGAAGPVEIRRASLAEVIKKDPKVREYFKFTIIRDPWTRTVSLYNKKIRNASAWRKMIILAKVPGLYPGMDFNEFCQWVDSPDSCDSVADKHWISPHLLLRDDTGKIDMDMVGKLESLDKDLRLAFSKVGLTVDPAAFVHKRSSNDMAKKPLYKNSVDYFNQATTAMVANRYRDYLDWSGYSFPS